MKTEPVLTAWLATIIAAVAARYGLHLDDAQAGALALAVGTLATWTARRYVTPTARPRVTSTLDLIERTPAAARQALDELQPPPQRGPVQQQSAIGQGGGFFEREDRPAE